MKFNERSELMKKFFASMMLLGMILVGCNKGDQTSTPNQSIPNSQFEVNNDTLVETDAWDDKIMAMLYYSVQEANTLVPQYEANSYHGEIGVDSNDRISITYTEITCYGVDESMAIDEYEGILLENGFSLSSESAMAFKEINNTDDLIIQYKLGSDSRKSFLILIIYRYTSRIGSWPTAVIESFVGYDIPHLDCKSYEVYSYEHVDYVHISLLIYCNGANSSDLNSYVNKLMNSGYIVTINNGTYQASTIYGDLDITCSMYGDIPLIMVTPYWPHGDIVSILGFPLPRLEVEGTDVDYNFIELSSGAYSLAIYYDFAYEVWDDYVAIYGKLLEEIGFVYDDEYSIETNAIYYYNRDDEKNEHMVQVVWSEQYNSLCIAIVY